MTTEDASIKSTQPLDDSKPISGGDADDITATGDNRHEDSSNKDVSEVSKKRALEDSAVAEQGNAKRVDTKSDS